jgi:hypothetical protein
LWSYYWIHSWAQFGLFLENMMGSFWITQDSEPQVAHSSFFWPLQRYV